VAPAADAARPLASARAKFGAASSQPASASASPPGSGSTTPTPGKLGSVASRFGGGAGAASSAAPAAASSASGSAAASRGGSPAFGGGALKSTAGAGASGASSTGSVSPLRSGSPSGAGAAAPSSSSAAASSSAGPTSGATSPLRSGSPSTTGGAGGAAASRWQPGAKTAAPASGAAAAAPAAEKPIPEFLRRKNAAAAAAAAAAAPAPAPAPAAAAEPAPAAAAPAPETAAEPVKEAPAVVAAPAEEAAPAPAPPAPVVSAPVPTPVATPVSVPTPSPSEPMRTAASVAIFSALADLRKAGAGSGAASATTADGFARRTAEGERLARELAGLGGVLTQAASVLTSSQRQNTTSVQSALGEIDAVKQALGSITAAAAAAASSSSSGASAVTAPADAEPRLASATSALTVLSQELKDAEASNVSADAEKRGVLALLQAQVGAVQAQVAAARAAANAAEAGVQSDLDATQSELAQPAEPAQHQAAFERGAAAAAATREAASAAASAALAATGADLEGLAAQVAAARTAVYAHQETAVGAQAALTRRVQSVSEGVSDLRKEVSGRLSVIQSAARARLEEVTGEAKARAQSDINAGMEARARALAGEASQAAEIGRLAQELAALKSVMGDSKNVAGQEKAIVALTEQLQNLRVAVALGSGGNPAYTAKVNGMYTELASLRKGLETNRADEAESAATQRAAVERIASQLAVLQEAVADNAGKEGVHADTVSTLLVEIDGVKRAMAATTPEARAGTEPLLTRMTEQLATLAQATAPISGEKGDALRTTVAGVETQVRELSKAWASSKAEAEAAQTEQKGAIERIQGQLASIAEAVAKAHSEAKDSDVDAARKYTATVAKMVQEFADLKTAMVDRRSFEATEDAVKRMTDHIQNLRVAVALSTSGNTKHIQQVAAMNAELYALRQQLTTARTAETEYAAKHSRSVTSIEEQLSELKKSVNESVSKEGEALAALQVEVQRLRESSEGETVASLASVSKMVLQLEEVRAAVALSQGTSSTQMAAVASLGGEIGHLREAVERSKVDSMLAAQSAKGAVESLQKQLEALAAVVASTPDIVKSLAKQIEDLKGATAAKHDLEGAKVSIERITEQLAALRGAVAEASGEGSKQMEAVTALSLQLAALQESVSSQSTSAKSSQLEMATRVERELSGLRSALDATKSEDESVLRTVLIMLEEVHTMRNAVSDALGVDVAQRSKIQQLAVQLESVRSDADLAKAREKEMTDRLLEAQRDREVSQESARRIQVEVAERSASERARLEAEAAKLREEMDAAITIAKMQKESAEAKIELVRIQAQEQAAAEIERIRTEAEIARLKLLAEMEGLRRAKEDAEDRARSATEALRSELEGVRGVLVRTQTDREDEARRFAALTAEKDVRLEEVSKSAISKLEQEVEAARKRGVAAVEEAEERLRQARLDGEARAADVLRRSEEQQRQIIADAEHTRLTMESAVLRARAEKEAAEAAARQVTTHLQERLTRAHALHESATREIKEAAAGFQLAASLRETMVEYERRLVNERKRVIYLERALGLPTSAAVVMLNDAPRGAAAAAPALTDAAAAGTTGSAPRASSPYSAAAARNLFPLSPETVAALSSAATGTATTAAGGAPPPPPPPPPISSGSAAPRTLPANSILESNRDAAFSALGIDRTPGTTRLGDGTAKLVAASVSLNEGGDPHASMSGRVADLEAGVRRADAQAAGLARAAYNAEMSLAAYTGTDMVDPIPGSGSPAGRGSASAAHAAGLPSLDAQTPRSAADMLALARAAGDAAVAAMPRDKAGHPIQPGDRVFAASGDLAKDLRDRQLAYGKLVEYMAVREKQAELVEGGLTTEDALSALRHRERVVLGDSGDMQARAKAIMDKVTYEAQRQALGQAALRRLKVDAARRAEVEAAAQLRLADGGRPDREPLWQDVLARAQALPALSNAPAVPPAPPAAPVSVSRASSALASPRTTERAASPPPPPPPAGPRPRGPAPEDVLAESAAAQLQEAVVAAASPSRQSKAPRAKSRSELESEVAELERLAALGGRALAAAQLMR
jgi:DNA repair exonuclease SbcCD ATPase subunit